MSSRDRRGNGPALSTVLAAAACLLAAAVSGCTVRPLYMSEKDAAGAEVGMRAQLASIAVRPVTTRYAQQVRNDLIFLLDRGGARPAKPKYTLTLVVTTLRQAAASIQINTDNTSVPTAATMTVTSTYVLADAATGKPISKGKRSVTASFDVPRQEFASLRAERDAEDRAARELAEQLHLALAQDLSRAPSS